MLQCFINSVVMARCCDVVSFFFQCVTAVPHGNVQPVWSEHGQVVIAIAEDDDILIGCSKAIDHFPNPIGFVHWFKQNTAIAIANQILRHVHNATALFLFFSDEGIDLVKVFNVIWYQVWYDFILYQLPLRIPG